MQIGHLTPRRLVSKLRASAKRILADTPEQSGLNPLGETVNYGQLGCVVALGCCAAAQGSLDSNSIGDK